MLYRKVYNVSVFLLNLILLWVYFVVLLVGVITFYGCVLVLPVSIPVYVVGKRWRFWQSWRDFLLIQWNTEKENGDDPCC